MLALVVIYLIKALFLIFLAWQQSRFAFGVQAQLSQRLFTIYLQQPYTFHLQRNSAQLIRNAVTEVNQFTFSGIVPGLVLFTEGLVLLGLATLLLVVEPVGALAVMLVLGVASLLFYYVTHHRITRWGEARQHHEGLRIQHLQQGLGGIKDIKLLGRESNFLNQYQVHNIQNARIGEWQKTLQQLPRLWLELLAVTGLAVLVSVMLIQGRELAAIMSTLGLFAAAFRLLPSVNRVLSSEQSLRFGLPVVNTLHEEVKLAKPDYKAKSQGDLSFCRSIQLEQIKFTYPDATDPTLTELSLKIQRGESVGFIGTSGAGKSTLVDIVLGLLTPDNGRVTVDGIDIQNNLRNWQDQIGYVPQSTFLTDSTLRHNVAFGLPDDEISDEAIWSALKAAQLGGVVKSLPDGLEANVGERGVRLSGGQCQRIGIARALYHAPAVLVLDEATSSLDTITERDVMRAITALHGDKTILIIAHRLSTVEHCDRLYQLEQGRVVDEGTFESMSLVKKFVKAT